MDSTNHCNNWLGSIIYPYKIHHHSCFFPISIVYHFKRSCVELPFKLNSVILPTHHARGIIMLDLWPLCYTVVGGLRCWPHSCDMYFASNRWGQGKREGERGGGGRWGRTKEIIPHPYHHNNPQTTPGEETCYRSYKSRWRGKTFWGIVLPWWLHHLLCWLNARWISCCT